MATFNTKGYDADSKKAIFSQGDKQQIVHAIAEVAVATADGDVFILARNLPLSTIVSRIVFPKGSAGITAATDYDWGIYKSSGDDLGAVLDIDILVAAKDMSAAIVAGADILTADATKTIGELLSLNEDQEPAGGVHLCMTANTAGSEAQDLDMDIVLTMAG
jgi:hypothetical protein